MCLTCVTGPGTRQNAPWPLADVDAAAAAATARPRRHPRVRRAPHPRQLVAATPAFACLAHSTSTYQLALDPLRIGCHPAPRLVHPLHAEGDKALAIAGSAVAGVAPNEPLVWVLWKILKGDGDDIGPCKYSPSALAPPLRGLRLRRRNVFDAPQRPPCGAPERTITPEEAARRRGERRSRTRCARVLSLAEQCVHRSSSSSLSSLRSGLANKNLNCTATEAAAPTLAPPDLVPLAAHNPALFAAVFSSSYSASRAAPSTFASVSATSAYVAPAAAPYLAALTALPSTLPTFDVLRRLLHAFWPSSLRGNLMEHSRPLPVSVWNLLDRLVTALERLPMGPANRVETIAIRDVLHSDAATWARIEWVLSVPQMAHLTGMYLFFCEAVSSVLGAVDSYFPTLTAPKALHWTVLTWEAHEDTRGEQVRSHRPRSLDMYVDM
ncbi:hypothetical protein FB451DRAFT_1556409 [Mycena latifolia]|nr:hypothetical protein FB451DRAFT_1556409 [Mycena latifolia]